ncbi:MAG TPA: beta-propeller domain-containing protein [Allosphingosinicella sp.]|jgi:hypothetical protein
MWIVRSAAATLLVLVACGSGRPTDSVHQDLFDGYPPVALERFPSQEAFNTFIDRARQRGAGYRLSDVEEPPPPGAEPPPPPQSLPSLEANGPPAEQASVDGSTPSITNNQTAGVDEGGIIKQIGRFLVVLQDGRLFSADLGAEEGAFLRLADRIDVYRSAATAADWYDEMLVLGSRILVTAYNYRELASEITVFQMDEAGRFTREGRFLLSSNDYYSTANYASRLVGDRLVLYAPVELSLFAEPRPVALPRLRRADGDGPADDGEPLLQPTEIYASPGEIEYPVMHVLSVCPLRERLNCRTTAFVGGSSREVYVTPTDAFLWIDAPDRLPWAIEYTGRTPQQCRENEFAEDRAHAAALLYRVPLHGGEIGAVAVDGLPANQFAFDSREGRFRALLSRPDGECRNVESGAPLALLDLPLDSFTTRIRHVSAGAYVAMPQIDGGVLRNRFVGDWLVYGRQSAEPGAGRTRPLYAVPVARPAEPVRLDLRHNAIRIERAGSDVVVTGYGDGRGLSLSYVSLGNAPRLAASTTLLGRYESEARSHAFNAWFRSDGTGLIGVPTSRDDGRSGRDPADGNVSELSFIAVASDRRLSPAGELALARRREPRGGYECRVSCVDWYGNARPIFTGGRIFALMGTDLVEGALRRGRIAEIGRVDLTGPRGVASR